ncbi:acetylornithine deacetylase [Legionella impletisoli]|uniref:Acetylornithine deacetylase n=1 Tax=Legionella impletisoli TaxID=343510 RepID=A0A917NE50_9GAMM|nr:acetylornithine deacetylase [Legionella impletisoli]GGI93292.1 acetylornithine deacetylase [Legionella impletisoli]
MDSKQWLTELISINTVSSHSNLELIERIDTWFKEHEILSFILPGPEMGKANLLATIPAKNGRRKGGLLLSGHTDVVDVGGQLWNSNPFAAKQKNGNIYGRGACDMKGFLAVLLALAPEFKALNLAKPIHFGFTYDEEVGCVGAEYFVEYLQKHKIQPEGCIVGEPSSMKPVVGEKCRQVYHGQIEGLASHSSLSVKGCNAIEYACRLVHYIHTLSEMLKQQGPFDYDFDLPYTTLTTNLISGGIASNIIPGICEFLLEIRYLPEFPIYNLRCQIERHIKEILVPEMKKSYAKANIYFETISDEPGFLAMEDANITRLTRLVTGINERLKVSYSTEAGIFQDAHIPTILCGPGNIEQAHGPNEYISIEQLKLCEHVLRNIVTLFCCDLTGN